MMHNTYLYEFIKAHGDPVYKVIGVASLARQVEERPAALTLIAEILLWIPHHQSG